MLFKSSIKDMKIDPRNKWRKDAYLFLTDSLTDSYYQDLIQNSIDSLTPTRSIKNYDFRISRSEIQPKFMCMCRVSFLITLDIYKAYFKSHHIWIQ